MVGASPNRSTTAKGVPIHLNPNVGICYPVVPVLFPCSDLVWIVDWLTLGREIPGLQQKLDPNPGLDHIVRLAF